MSASGPSGPLVKETYSHSWFSRGVQAPCPPPPIWIHTCSLSYIMDNSILIVSICMGKSINIKGLTYLWLIKRYTSGSFKFHAHLIWVSAVFTHRTYPIQGSHRLEKYLNIQDGLEKSLKIKFALKNTGNTLKNLEKSLNFTIYRSIQHCHWRPKTV